MRLISLKKLFGSILSVRINGTVCLQTSEVLGYLRQESGFINY